MDYYLSDEFLKESLKAMFCPSYVDIDELDEHVSLIELSIIFSNYPELLKIELLEWAIHQRLFVDPDILDDLIHQSIFDISSAYKNRPRMNLRDFEEMYSIYGSIKVAFFEEFCETLEYEIDCEREHQYLNQKN